MRKVKEIIDPVFSERDHTILTGFQLKFVEYETQDPLSILKNLWIERLENSVYSITLFAQNKHTFSFLEEIIQRNHCFGKISPLNRMYHHFCFKSDNLELIAHFVNVMSRTIPEFYVLKGDLAHYIGCDLSQKYIVPRWIHARRSDEIREYINTNRKSIIEKIFLEKTPRNDYRITAFARDNEEYKIFHKIIQENPLLKGMVIVQNIFNYIQFKTDMVSKLGYLFQRMSQAFSEPSTYNIFIEYSKTLPQRKSIIFEKPTLLSPNNSSLEQTKALTFSAIAPKPKSGVPNTTLDQGSCISSEVRVQPPK